MKIKDYNFKGDVLQVSTDKGDFAYPVDKFGSVEQLSAEIERKIKWRAERAEHGIIAKKAGLVDDFASKGIKEKIKIVDAPKEPDVVPEVVP